MDSNDAQRKPPFTATVPSARGSDPRDSRVRSTTVQSGPLRRADQEQPSDGSLPVEVGAVVNGKYRIDGVLGQGGVGVVYYAQHLELDERVALKFLKTESVQDPQIVARFGREAKAALSIKSEHVARILDVGTVQESGIPFIVMEYLEGQDFCTTLKQNGVFSVLEVAEYMLHVCEALAIAHAKGIVHRDIKPENLFLTTTQKLKVVKVLDFGISKAALTGSVFRSEIPLLQTSQLMGTPLYMSPEQVRASSNVDARSDIWSLGLVIYEMLTGTTAFQASSLTELCVAIIERDVTPVRNLRPDVPEGLALAVQRCLQRDPAARYQHVGALANALLPFAPKRARICAERAVAVLLEAGIAEPELKVHSTMPPPTEEAMAAAAIITQKIRAAQGSAPEVVEASEIVAPQTSRRPPMALVVGGASVLILAIAAALALSHRAPMPAAAASSTPMVPPSVVAVAPPPAAPGGTLVPGAASMPPTASATTEVQPTMPPGSASAAALSHRAPPRTTAAPSAAPSASAPKPATKKPLSDEGPDLGY